RGRAFGDIEDTRWLPLSRFVDPLLLFLGLWGCGHRSCDVHKSTGRCGAQIDGTEPLGAEVDAEYAVLADRSQRDTFAAERLAEPDAALVDGDVAVLVGFANAIGGAVLDRRQGVRERSRAVTIALSWPGEIERFMWAIVVVDMPPAVEGALALRQVREM